MRDPDQTQMPRAQYWRTNRNAATGALKKAAETTQARLDDGERVRRSVGVSVVEAYGKEVNPRELDSTLRMEYRTKLLNPKWSEAMSKQASPRATWRPTRLRAIRPS